ncbi:MAG TPA: hypothetical protein ENI80_04505 [Acidiferrobacteraceae bacterium]|nr:hypothetical protein [Acidiferrobacteraceae bacterium]
MAIRQYVRASPWGALFICALFYGAALSGAWASSETAITVKVIDGDTLVLGDGRHLRLVGVNCPEQGYDGRPDEPWARAATAYTRRQLLNKKIHLKFGPQRQDRYKRTLAQVFTEDGQDFQIGLLERGLASAVAIAPNVDHADAYLRVERIARRQAIGLWGDAYYKPKAAQGLSLKTRGFHFVRGHIQRIGKSRRYIYLDLSDRFSVRISRKAWQQYWTDNPKDWRGALVEVRGWVNLYNSRLNTTINHPTMIEKLE